MKIKIKRFDKSLPLPSYEKPGCVGFDLPARETVEIAPHTIGLVRLNVAIAIPAGHVVLLFPRSSTPLLKGLTLANSIGVIDPYFSGDKDELVAMWHNITGKTATVEQGEILLQGVLLKYERADFEEVAKMQHPGDAYWALPESNYKSIPTHTAGAKGAGK